MKNKITSIIVLSIFLISIIFIATPISSEVSYCCEKTIDGDWCIPASQDYCEKGYQAVPTSCEATSYCKMGTCIDSEEGTCMENTPEKVCEEAEGVWEEGDPDDVAQCQLGCCLIGDQAAFVTQSRCKRLSALYGLETNYRTDMQNEVACIASATSDVKGACVFEKEFEKTCQFLTKSECQSMESSKDSDVSFHEGFLCSAEVLETNCGPTEQTTCIEGRDEVYFVDTCGNLANIYDADKIDDKIYWKDITDAGDVCALTNANIRKCGSCDYYAGTTCKSAERGDNPVYGDNICRDLGCEYKGEDYEHGETWCDNSEGAESSLPGSRYFRLVCYNGGVTVEPCADFRQEVCIQSGIGEFKTAACRVNKWQDCASQSNSEDCENSDRRDCKWLSSECVPRYSPGFNFWEDGDAQSLCPTASSECDAEYEKKIGGDWELKDDSDCLDDNGDTKQSWTDRMNNVCVSIGDCGNSGNYLE